MMRVLLPVVLAVGLLSGCASVQQVPVASVPLRDDLFGPPSVRPSADAIFALSQSMRDYLRTEAAPLLRLRGPERGLLEALHQRGHVKLEYDASYTRNAAEAFDARQGNCISLVIMTAALAKELKLSVRFQSASLEENWTRSGKLLLRSGHVNVTIEPRLDMSYRSGQPDRYTVDFLPPDEIRGLKTVEISEATVVAMYMNNRAVELLVRGRVDDAYAWAREAIRHAPAYAGAHNTLGILYLERQADDAAEQVFRTVLAADPRNTRALANLAETLTRQGRLAEAHATRQRLASLEEAGPYHWFRQGMVAMRGGEYAKAQAWFAKELSRAEYNAEFHYWMGIASHNLGDDERAKRHLALALEYSSTGDDRALYGSKLAKLKANRSLQ